MGAASARLLITTADDFGLSIGVNEAVEQAAAHGFLTSASLMVAGPAAEDAVSRARRLPGLAVGLHLVLVDGMACLPPADLPDLLDTTGRFPANQTRLGFRYFFRPPCRAQLRAEIRAQFEAFRKTGLTLDHANAHKHMHLHPVVGRMMIEIGRQYGLRAIRVPREPDGAGIGAWALRHWCAILRGQARRAGLLTNDHVFGLSQSGHMTDANVGRILANLPPGLSEMYFHPATQRDARLRALMPAYEHEAECRALMRAVVPEGVWLGRFGEVRKEGLLF